MKILLVRAKLLHADWQTDFANLLVTFRNFAIPPKNWTCFIFNCQSHLIYTFVNINIIIILQPVLSWRKFSEGIKRNSSEYTYVYQQVSRLDP